MVVSERALLVRSSLQLNPGQDKTREGASLCTVIPKWLRAEARGLVCWCGVSKPRKASRCTSRFPYRPVASHPPPVAVVCRPVTVSTL